MHEAWRNGPVVVVGGTGRLGRALAQELSRRGTDHRLPLRDELDLLDRASIRRALSQLKPRLLINAAAFTAVAEAEREELQRQVFGLNRDGPGWLAEFCGEFELPLVHVSTDYVFDGSERRPYREDDPVGPLQVYGRSKLEGEARVLEAHPGAVVVRVSTLYGPGPHGHYVRAILDQARRSTRIEVVRLPIASPTYAPDLARAVLALVEVGASGVVHAVNTGSCSRLELARAAVRFAGLGDRVEVSERPDPGQPPSRPFYSALATDLYTRLTGRALRPWDAALREYVRQQHGG